MKTIPIISQAALALSAGLLLTACSSNDYDEPAYSSTGYSSTEYSSTDQQMETSRQTTITEASGAQSDRQLVNELNIPLHEERVNVGKRTVDAGEVTIRKIVTTETVNQPVQLRRESLVIDRSSDASQQSSLSQSTTSSEWQPSAETQKRSAEIQTGSPQALEPSEERVDISSEPAGAATSSATAESGGAAFQAQSYTIRLQAEQPVIEKNIVQTGRVTAQKSSQTEQQNVTQQVRREDVLLDRSGAPNVEIRGDFKSAGQPLEEPSGAERRSSADSTSSRVPSQGQGVQDLKPQADRP